MKNPLHIGLAMLAVTALTTTACSRDDDEVIVSDADIQNHTELNSASSPAENTNIIALTEPAITAPIVQPTNYGNRRYCEVVAIKGNLINGFQAHVYTTHGLNACPQAQWQALDKSALQKQLSAISIKFNGPRQMIVDQIEQTGEPPESVWMGDIEMKQRATVTISPLLVMQGATTPYTENKVKRHTLFTFKKGSRAYFLTTPQATYIMQSFAQIVDPNLNENDLQTLDKRLKLPDNWFYSSQILTQDILVDSNKTEGYTFVLQDELENSYSRLDTKIDGIMPH